MSMLSAALALAKRGFFVFPCYAVLDAGTPNARCSCALGADCGSPGKHPIGNTARGRGEGGVYAASRDKAQLRGWWGRWPKLNPAVRTGMDGLVVLDVDGAEGFETVAKLEAELGALPPTLTARSGRAEGGAHMWFRAPSLAALGSRKIAPGLDLKAAGGYVVAPGARHKTGTFYAWTHEARAPELPAAWLAWAHQAVEEKQARETFERPRFDWTGDPGDKVGKLLARLASAPEGARNDTLNEVAYTLGGLHAGGQCEDVRERLLDAALSLGLDERETRATIRSGWVSGEARPILPRALQTPEEIAAILASFRKAPAEVAQDPAPASPVLEEAETVVAPQALVTPRSSAASEAPAPWDLLEKRRAGFEAARTKKNSPPAPPAPRVPGPLSDVLLSQLSHASNDLRDLVLARGLRWDDRKGGAREVIAQAVAGVLVENDVALQVSETIFGMLDRRMEEADPGCTAGFEPLPWARSTLRRELRGIPNSAARTLLNVLGEEEGAGFLAKLTAAAKEWAAQAPIASDLSSFEKDRLEHRRVKANLLLCLNQLDEGGFKVDDGLRKTLVALIHCSDYCQIHRSECCDVCYGKQTRVCEIFCCTWCGPRARAERARLATDNWKANHETLDVVTIDTGCDYAEDVEKIRRAVTQNLTKYYYMDCKQWRWFEAPQRVIFFCKAGEGSQLELAASTAMRGAKLADKTGVTFEQNVSIDAAIAMAQRAWFDRSALVHRAVNRAVLSMKKAQLGDAKAGRAAELALQNLSEAGWVRDVRWQGGSTQAHKTLLWPSREQARKALKERAAREREAAGKVSSKPPERCPAHNGRVVIDLLHGPSKRVVASGLRSPVGLLDAVRLDPARLANVPPRVKKKVEISPETLAYTAAAVAKWKARRDAVHSRD